MPKRNWPVEGVAAELLVLLETVTADGVITEEEARNLKGWLDTNQNNLELPGLEFLRLTVTQVLADGKVTDAERTAVYKAVERILPPEARRLAKERRGAVEGIKRESVRAERDAAKEHRLQERDRDWVIGRDNFMVAGVAYEGRAGTVETYAYVGHPVFLLRDPGNEYDPNAIKIILRQGYVIGFAPRASAAALAPLLDKGCKHAAHLTKILKGRIAPIPIVDCSLYGPNAERSGAVQQSDIPEETEAPTADHATDDSGTPQATAAPQSGCGSSGCGCALVLLILVFGLWILR